MLNDTELHNAILAEQERSETTISLIASENYAPLPVLQATGSVLTNKYAEGYPGKRYYAGCKAIDTIESLAIERCKKLFNAEHANVQPHAGSQANLAVYFATLQPGDTILGMGLAEGGHLTHGHPMSISGRYFNAVQYTVSPKTELLDYDQIEQLAHKHRPKLIIAGASAYSRAIDFARFKAIADSVSALLLADIAHIAGLVATNLHQSPIAYADFVTGTTHKTLRGPRGGFILSTKQHAQAVDKAVMPGTQGGPFMNVIAAKAIAFRQALDPSFVTYQQQVVRNAKAMVEALKEHGYRIVTDGTDNHLFVVDLRSKNLTGAAAQTILEQAGIMVSKSCIPFDPEKPWITSGIRIGTPAITTRGIKEQTALKLVYYLDKALKHHDNELVLRTIQTQIKEICMQHPIYQL